MRNTEIAIIEFITKTFTSLLDDWLLFLKDNKIQIPKLKNLEEFNKWHSVWRLNLPFNSPKLGLVSKNISTIKRITALSDVGGRGLIQGQSPIFIKQIGFEMWWLGTRFEKLITLWENDNSKKSAKDLKNKINQIINKKSSITLESIEDLFSNINLGEGTKSFTMGVALMGLIPVFSLLFGLIMNKTEFEVIQDIVSNTNSEHSPSAILRNSGYKTKSFIITSKVKSDFVKDVTISENKYKVSRNDIQFLKETNMSITKFILSSFKPLLSDWYLFLKESNMKYPQFNSLDDFVKWNAIWRSNVSMNKMTMGVTSKDIDVNSRLFGLNAFGGKGSFTGQAPLMGKVIGQKIWWLGTRYQRLIKIWKEDPIKKDSAIKLEKGLEKIIKEVK